jgi:hypothetical protein
VYSQQVQLQVAAVKTPGFGDNLKSILGDLAILTGGTVFMDELDIKLERATVDLLSSTGSITITKEDTIVLNGEGAKDAIQTRCEQIQALITDPTTSNCNHTKLQEHVAKLSGGVTVIKVGGSSEVEVGEKKDPYDDAGATMTRLRQALNLAVVTVESLKLPNHFRNHRGHDMANMLWVSELPSIDNNLPPSHCIQVDTIIATISCRHLIPEDV